MSKVTKTSYKELINNLNGKLNGWKEKTLTFAERVTLAQSIL